jgi:hypothetical protein
MDEKDASIERIAKAVNGALSADRRRPFAKAIADAQEQTAKAAAAEALDTAIGRRDLAANDNIRRMLSEAEERMTAMMEAKLREFGENIIAGINRRFDLAEARITRAIIIGVVASFGFAAVFCAAFFAVVSLFIRAAVL